MARTPAGRTAQKRYEKTAKGKATYTRYREKRQRLVELGRAVEAKAADTG
jgi:DNA-binding PadR family transcriptional regulator